MSLSASSPARPLLHGIQAVRGLFAVLVVCHHIGVQSAHYFGHDWMGGFFNQSTYRVDFFFVLSGFVLWTAHQAEAGRPGAWLGFLGKRLWRLYPLLVVLTLLKVLLLWLIPGRDAGSYNLLPSLLALPQNSFPVIVAAWFLPFEIYFVTALAACLALPRRASLPALVTWAVMLSAAGFFLGIRPSIHGVGFLIHPFVLEFAAGALAAECVRRQPGGRRPPRHAVVWCRLGRACVWGIESCMDQCVFGRLAKVVLGSRVCHRACRARAVGALRSAAKLASEGFSLGGTLQLLHLSLPRHRPDGVLRPHAAQDSWLKWDMAGRAPAADGAGVGARRRGRVEVPGEAAGPLQLLFLGKWVQGTNH